MIDVVITGVGAVTPLGVGAHALHERWTAGVCGVRDGEAPCADFRPTDHLSVKEARRADRCTQLAVVASDEAIVSAGWDGGLPYDPREIGCIIGTGIGGIGTLEANHTVLERDGAKAVSPLAVPLMMSNAPAAALSMRHDLRGHVYGIVSACAAGAHAIGSAARAIQAGDAIAVVTGGAEAALTPLSRAAFAALAATSPTGISRPFDLRRDGFVMGEGAGVLVLENGDSARARGARILGTIRGYGATSDAHHITAPHERGEGAQAAIEGALAGRGPDGGGDRLRQRARDVDAAQRPGGDAGDQGGTGGVRDEDPGLVDEVGDRPSAGSGGCGRGCGDDPRAPRPGRAADDRLGGAGSGSRPRLRAGEGPSVRRAARGVGRRRSRTRSALADTTSSYVWRQHEPEARAASE